MYLQNVSISIGILVFEYAILICTHTINVGKILTYMLVCGVTELAEAPYCHVEYSLSLDPPFVFNLYAIQHISLLYSCDFLYL
jgi:hypothetical protein